MNETFMMKILTPLHNLFSVKSREYSKGQWKPRSLAVNYILFYCPDTQLPRSFSIYVLCLPIIVEK